MAIPEVYVRGGRVKDSLYLARMIAIVTKHDIPEITKLVNAAYHGAPGTKSWTSESHLVAGERTTEENLMAFFEKPFITLLKYTDENGTITGSVLLEKKEHTIYLGMLSVSPETQATGIGKRLLQHAEAFALEQGYNSITITVIDKRLELIDWYKRKGFVPTGKLEPFSNSSSAAKENFMFMEMRKDLP